MKPSTQIERIIHKDLDSFAATRLGIYRKAFRDKATQEASVILRQLEAERKRAVTASPFYNLDRHIRLLIKLQHLKHKQ